MRFIKESHISFNKISWKQIENVKASTNKTKTNLSDNFPTNVLAFDTIKLLPRKMKCFLFFLFLNRICSWANKTNNLKKFKFMKFSTIFRI